MAGLPTFRSSSPGSLFWGATYDAANRRCSSQGKTVVQDLQDGAIRYIRDNATVAVLTDWLGQPSINNIPVSPSDIHADGEFDGYTMLALYLMVLNDTSAPPAVRDAIISDWNANNTNPQDSTWSPIVGGSRAFSPLTVKAIIWKSQHPDLQWQWVYVDPATVGPVYSTPAVDDGDANGDVTCAAAPTLTSDDDVSNALPDLSSLYNSTPGNVAARGIAANTPTATPRSYPLIAPGNTTAAANLSTGAKVGIVAAAIGGAAAVVGTILLAMKHRGGRRHRR